MILMTMIFPCIYRITLSDKTLSHKIIVGQIFRHLAKISSVLSDKVSLFTPLREVVKLSEVAFTLCIFRLKIN